MSINVALCCKEVIGAVIGLSGNVFSSLQDLINEDKEGAFYDKKKNLRMFIYHGKEDDIIDYEKASHTYKKL
jgi:predicted esterase